MKRSFANFIAALSFVCVSQGQFQKPAPTMMGCFEFDRVYLVGTFIEVDIGNDGILAPGDMSLTTSLAIEETIANEDYEISELSVQAVCTFLENDAKGNPTAPMCLIEADMTFNYEKCVTEPARNKWERARTICQTENPSGRFMATGTGPEAYAITGGVGDFFGATGFFNPDFPSATAAPGRKVILPTEIYLCF